MSLTNEIYPSSSFDDLKCIDAPEHQIFNFARAKGLVESTTPIESDNEDEQRLSVDLTQDQEQQQEQETDQYKEQDDEIIKMLENLENQDNDEVDKIMLKDAIIILNPQDVVIKKKVKYTDAHRRAQAKYREKFPEKYRELQRSIYDRLKQNEEWKKKFNEKNKESQKKYREKKREELLNQGIVIKPRGRPRKDVVKENVELNQTNDL